MASLRSPPKRAAAARIVAAVEAESSPPSAAAAPLVLDANVSAAVEAPPQDPIKEPTADRPPAHALPRASPVLPLSPTALSPPSGVPDGEAAGEPAQIGGGEAENRRKMSQRARLHIACEEVVKEMHEANPGGAGIKSISHSTDQTLDLR